MIYLSDTDLATRYHVTRQTIWRWHREKSDFPRAVRLPAGCTRWKLPEIEVWEDSQEKNPGDGRLKNVEIRGENFPSCAHAARDLDINWNTVKAAKRRGNLDKAGLGREKQIVVRGTTYDSISDAAKALGVSQSRVSHAKRLGRLDALGKRRWP